MAEKSHVSIEQNVCVVCCAQYETGSILLDTKLGRSLERTTLTGWGMCPEHQKLKDSGFIAIIGCSNEEGDTAMKPDEVDRTGEFAHVRKSAFGELFNIKPPEHGVLFANQVVIEYLKELL